MKRLRIFLWYKDGSARRLQIAVPDEVANEVQRKGLMATTVLIDAPRQFPVNGHLDGFKAKEA